MADNVIIALLSILPTTIASIGTLIVALKTQGKVLEVAHATNSMKDALVAAALLAGKHEGIAEEKQRNEAAIASRVEGAQDEKDRIKNDKNSNET